MSEAFSFYVRILKTERMKREIPFYAALPQPADHLRIWPDAAFHSNAGSAVMPYICSMGTPT